MKIKALLVESFRSGTIASVAIVPLSPIFKAAGLRIGHYGPKFAGLYVSVPPTLVTFCATPCHRLGFSAAFAPHLSGHPSRTMASNDRCCVWGGLLCGDQLAGIADLFQRPASLATWSLHRAAQPYRPCDLRRGDRPNITAFCDPHQPATGCDVRQVDLTGRP